MGLDYLAQLEENDHFWIRGKQMVVEDFVGRLNPQSVLDVGCGTGLSLRQFRLKPTAVTGVDILPAAIERCQEILPGGRFIQADAAELPLEDRSFDLALALDIIEHVPKETCPLGEIFRVLKPGGHLIVSVPAFKRLFSLRDRGAGHLRRYDKSELVAILEAAGFSIKYLNYFNFFLFPALLLARLLNLNEKNPGAVANAVFGFVIRLEVRLARRISFPWGSSLIAIGEKVHV